MFSHMEEFISVFFFTVGMCNILVLQYSRKKDESQESDFKDAVTVCLPLINAAIRDIEKGVFPKSCLLNIEIPASPLTNKVCVFQVKL